MDLIETQLKNVDWNDWNSIVHFYESNSLYFNNYQIITDQEKVDEFISIKLHYANALYHKSQFEKVLTILDHVIELLSKLTPEHRHYKQADRQAQFLKGMVLSNRKSFKESYPIFKRLTAEDPEHHFYKVWLDHTRLGLFNWIFTWLSYIGLALIIMDLVFDLDERLAVDIGTIGLVVVLLSYLIQKGIAEYFKKKKKNIGTRQ